MVMKQKMKMGIQGLTLMFLMSACDITKTDSDGDGWDDQLDCNVADPDINPGMAEDCDDNLDNNCDGLVDEDDPVCDDLEDSDIEDSDIEDNDNDGYHSGIDCDDYNNRIHPGASENCSDGIDNDCDGAVDEDDSECVGVDGDGDGYTGDVSDCDDDDASVHPGADENCSDNIDNDCDGAVDANDTDCDGEEDIDGDGWTPNEGDCDDTNSDINPNESETCNDTDDDCDGDVDEDAIDEETWYYDADGDNYGSSTSTESCSQPNHYVSATDDCDDNDSNTHPGASEDCDGTDNDCDGYEDYEEGCSVGTLKVFEDDCNTGCSCAVGSGSSQVGSDYSMEDGVCVNLSTANRGAQIDILPDSMVCPSGGTIRVTVYKGASCTSTSTFLDVPCSSSGVAWNLNCEDSDGDGYGDFDNHVDSFIVEIR